MTSRAASVWFCLVCVGLAAVLFVYARPVVLLLETKTEFGSAPEVWLVPKPLAPPSESSIPPSREISYFGYVFDVPNAEVETQRKNENLLVVSLADCARIVLLNPQPSFTDLVREGKLEARAVEEAYGREAAHSAYLLRRAVLSVTPKDLTLFASPHRIVRNSVLLTLKSVGSERFKNGLYSFETSRMHGFLEGDLVLDKAVLVQAFDTHDHEVDLIVAREPSRACFGQAELMRAIFSLRPASPTR